MASDKTDSLTTAFARSLLELAKDQNQLEPVAQELQSLRQVFDADPAVRDFFGNPAIAREQRNRVLDTTLASQASPLVRNFLHVAEDHDMLRRLPEISEAYDDLLDELLGKVEVDVTVAQRLTPEQLESVRQRVSQAIKKDAIAHQYVDDSIIGGMVLRIGDQVIDGSVKAQLDQMRQRLLSTRR